jgi:prefoldin beta subunit
MDQEKIQQLQAIEQSLQTFSLQKQNIQSQLMEIESALKELEQSEESYKIIGNVMIKANNESLVSELQEKEASLKNRLETADKQEQRLQKEAKSLQESLMQK